MGCYHTGGLDEYLDWMMEQSLIKEYKMSSGRDVMMEGWSQEHKHTVFKQKTHLERMKDYRETLLAELERLNYHISELEAEQDEKI
jgi:hypothetical protein